MKKFLLTAVLAVIGFTASAQLVQSTSINVRRESNTMWYLRAGISINGVTDWDSSSSAIGEDIVIGFHKSIGESGTYWGQEFGFGTRGCKSDYLPEWNANYDESLTMMSHVIKYSPFNFGYKYAITEDLKLDGHLGVYASYDIAKSGDLDDEGGWENDFDIGMNVGIGAWYKKFNFDFSYQRGFVPSYDCNFTAFLIRVGFAF